MPERKSDRRIGDPGDSNFITLFLCGDVMTGRGIDQILPHPGDPKIHEPYLKSSQGYVQIAEEANGPIPKPVEFSYIWGDALAVLEKFAPDLRIINLETSITRSDDYWQGKGINYRMNPENIASLTAAHIDVCSLANNHVLDWGYAGLQETLQTLKEAKIAGVGAGKNLQEAEAPAVMKIERKGRVIVFSLGAATSGIPFEWAASLNRAGIKMLEDLSETTVQSIQEKVEGVKKKGDIVIASIHWGGNWGYEIPSQEKKFAHRLVAQAGIDLVHGHSSHHVKGIEIQNGKLILYGCGDFLNDYEGIRGYENYRDDLGLMYFASIDPADGRLVRLRMVPTQIKKFKVNRASQEDARWLRDGLNRQGGKLGTRAHLENDSTLTLEWD